MTIDIEEFKKLYDQVANDGKSRTEKELAHHLAFICSIHAEIKENNSMLQMAKTHMDSRAIFVIANRIDQLCNELKNIYPLSNNNDKLEPNIKE